jgi:hypothetical protein
VEGDVRETLRIVGLMLWMPVAMLLVMFGIVKPPKD